MTTEAEQKQIEEDIKNLSEKQLRKKYKLNYSSFINMHKRKEQGAIVSQDFNEFSDFLRLVGIRKNKNYTLDRKNNDDPEYSKEKVRWADKYVQNNNRSNNIYLTHDDGKKHTVAQWAELTNQKPTTLYKRKSNGWNDMEVITGKRIAFKSSIARDPFPFKTKSLWDKKYGQHLMLGGGLPKLDFLFLELENIEETNDELAIIEAFINRKLGLEVPCQCDGDFCDQYCGMDYIDHIADSENQELIKKVREFEQFPVNQLEQMAELKKLFIGEYDHVYPEVKAMYVWESNKKKAKRNKSIDKVTFLKYFNAQFPKLRYTINLPVVEGDKK